MAEPLFNLHSAWLRNRITELGLKQWWLAEQLLVDRKTVLRWVNGQVRTIQRDNAVALAAILGCRLDELGAILEQAHHRVAAGHTIADLAIGELLDRRDDLVVARALRADLGRDGLGGLGRVSTRAARGHQQHHHHRQPRRGAAKRG